MNGRISMSGENPTDDLRPVGDVPVTPAVGVAALALNFALKYYGISTVQDGALYQQYKLEGRNMRELHLDMVFETALQMEAYMLGASERIAKMVVEAVLHAPEADSATGAAEAGVGGGATQGPTQTGR